MGRAFLLSAALAAPFILAAAPAAARCGLGAQIDALETTLETALGEAPPGRQAAAGRAAQLLSALAGAGESAGVEVERYRAERAAALDLVLRGETAAAAARLGGFDPGPARRRAAAAGGDEACEEGSGVTAGAIAEGALSRAAVERADRSDAGAEAGSEGAPTRLRSETRTREADAAGGAGDALLAAVAYAALGLPAALGLLWLGLLRRKRRREARYLCYLPVTVRLGKLDYELVMVDFSLRGARLSGEAHELEEKDRIEIDLGPARRRARVRWARGANAGLRFETPLTMRELDALLHAARAGAGVETKG